MDIREMNKTSNLPRKTAMMMIKRTKAFSFENDNRHRDLKNPLNRPNPIEKNIPNL
jgi:hypothetical protein